MLLIAIFNLSKPLEPIEKWEDRLQTVHLQLNKIREYLRSYPHKKISTAVIILTPNATLFPMNKAREYLKIPERSLQILELQTLKTELKRYPSKDAGSRVCGMSCGRGRWKIRSKKKRRTRRRPMTTPS